MPDRQKTSQQLCRAALNKLGIDKLVLAIHDQSFPSLPEEEIGRGTPYGKGAREFVRFISALGFNAIQLGPQGKTSLSNPSPYDSTIFSKSDLSISLLSLVQDEPWQGLLDKAYVFSLVDQKISARDKKSYVYCWHAQQKALRQAHEKFNNKKEQYKQLRHDYEQWSAEQSFWLERDGLFETLSLLYATDDWRQWDEPDRQLFGSGNTADATTAARIAELKSKYNQELDFYKFCQFVAHKQHRDFRKFANALGLELFADVQIGFSQRDLWGMRYLFLPNYLLGAPPSRTNPDGQPWGYPLLNPDLYESPQVNGFRTKPGPALQWLEQRIDKLLVDFDGLRIDHPHGIICPWVYKATASDALQAVQNGARLFDSPAVNGHEQLAKFAIVSGDQLASAEPRYADGWVKELTDAQVDRYAVLVKAIIDRVLATGMSQNNVICEVLSSCPYPLKRVMERFGLGRFRVTQKAQTNNPQDVYRSDKAAAADWIMVGTHDTKPLWLVVDEWSASQKQDWASYLSRRLATDSKAQAALATELLTDKGRLCEALFADLFIGPARNVQIFFPDLFGMKQIYNQPGVTNDANWTLSVPGDYQAIYNQRAADGEALNLPRVLALALQARFPNDKEAQAIKNELLAASRIESE